MPIVNEELSERELEILSLLATGVSNKEIASQLSISTNTVKVHVRNIFAKIGASSRTEAVLYAMKTGLIPPAAARVDEVVTESALDDDSGDRSGDAGQALQWSDATGPAADLPVHRKIPGWAGWLAVLALLAATAAGYWVWRSNQATQVDLPPVSSQDAARWKTLSSMSVARQRLAGVAFEGVIYAIAGQTAAGPTGAVERYNPADDGWKMLAEKPTPVEDVSAAVAGGEIYVPGGRLASGQVTDVLEIYNPRQDTWRQGSPLPEARSAYALVAHEGRLYLFGGWDGSKFVDTVYRYDPEVDAWQQKSSLPRARGYSGAALVGRKIYLLGGYNGRQAFKENLVYLPDLDDGMASPWETGQPLPFGRYGMGAASIAEMVQLVGGIQEDESQSILSLSYLTYNNTWQEFGKLQEKSPAYPAVASVGNFIYVLGGQVGGEPTAANLAYQAIYTLSFPIIH